MMILGQWIGFLFLKVFLQVDVQLNNLVILQMNFQSLKISCTTADTSVGAAEYHRLQTKFEGQDLQRFAKGTSSKEYTLSFHCKANAAATYVVELYDQDNQRTVAKTFSVTTNWAKVVLTFPAEQVVHLIMITI